MYKRILIKLGLWLGLGIFLMFYGITHSLALTYTNVAELRDVTVVLVSSDASGNNAPINVPVNATYNLYYVFQVDYIINNYNFEANKNYQLESHLPNQVFTNVNYYSVTGSSGESCLISYENSILNNNNYPRWAFQCPRATNSVTITIKNSSNEYLWPHNDTNIFTWQTALLKYSDTSLSGSGSDTDNIINNNNQNTQNIINNQNSNTQDIINNNNQNTQKIIDSNKENFQTCRDSYNLLKLNKGNYSIYGINTNVSDDYLITITGSPQYDWGYINDITPLQLSSGTYTFSRTKNNYNMTIQWNYSDGTYSRNGLTTSKSNTITFNKDVISYRIWVYGLTVGQNPNISDYYMLQKGNVATDYEEYGKEICTNKLDEQKNAINNLDDTLNDSDTTDAQNEASDFFSSFTTNTFGLTSIITAPLNLIQSVLSSTCNDLQLPLPYLNNKFLTLPCMTSIYSQHFGTFFTIYQTITYGIIAYWVCVRIFNQVKDFKNPEHDEIEVMDL